MHILLSEVYCVSQAVKPPTVSMNTLYRISPISSPFRPAPLQLPECCHRFLQHLVACDTYVRCSTLSSVSTPVTRERQRASLVLLFRQVTLQFRSQVGNLHVWPDTRPLYKLLTSHTHTHTHKHTQHPVSQSTKHIYILQNQLFALKYTLKHSLIKIN